MSTKTVGFVWRMGQRNQFTVGGVSYWPRMYIIVESRVTAIATCLISMTREMITFRISSQWALSMTTQGCRAAISGIPGGTTAKFGASIDIQIKMLSCTHHPISNSLLAFPASQISEALRGNFRINWWQFGPGNRFSRICPGWLNLPVSPDDSHCECQLAKL
jgi:hypothetical protein